MIKKTRGSLKPHNSSIVLNLKPVLAARNIMHPTAFLIKIGINNSTAGKMLKGEAVQLNFRQLTQLCMNLNCTPNDLFALRNMELPVDHALKVIKPLISEEDSISITEWLAGKSIKEIREMMKE
jgi:DNA-binding Xre family transcriptional regulator